MTIDIENRFVGSDLWVVLPRKARNEIGAIALELVAAWYCSENSGSDGVEETPLGRAANAADVHLIESLQRAFVDAVPRGAIENADGEPLLPSLLGPVCRECGCSESDACFPTCGWHAPGLCTACASETRP